MNSDEMDYAIRTNSFDGYADSGDLGVVRWVGDRLFVAAIDVAGHGTNAASLAKQINDFLQSDSGASLASVVHNLHTFIRGSRGCAGSFVLIDPASGESSYIGVGNTQGRIVGKNANKVCKPRRHNRL